MLLLLAGCEQRIGLTRELTSFQVELTSPIGSSDHRCLLPGTPTTGADLRGCPTYEKDAEPVRRMLKFERDLAKQIKALMEQYHQTQKELRLSPANVQKVIEVALELSPGHRDH